MFMNCVDSSTKSVWGHYTATVMMINTTDTSNADKDESSDKEDCEIEEESKEEKERKRVLESWPGATFVPGSGQSSSWESSSANTPSSSSSWGPKHIVTSAAAAATDVDKSPVNQKQQWGTPVAKRISSDNRRDTPVPDPWEIPGG